MKDRICIGIDARFAGVAQGGIGRYVEQMVRGLLHLSSPWRYVLFLRKKNKNIFDGVLREGDRTVVADIPWYGVREQWELPRLLGSARCNLYHYPHFNIPLFAPRPYLMTLHDLIMWERGRERDTTQYTPVARMKEAVMRATVRRGLARAVAWVVPTQWVASRVHTVAGVSLERSSIVPEGADALVQSISQPWDNVQRNHNLHRPFILVVGSAYLHKHNRLIIDAMRTVVRETDCLLVHVGPEHPRVFYQNLVAYGENELGERYTHLGIVSDDVLTTLYHHASCYVTASEDEGFGLPAVEAMWCGTPVIAPRTSCFPEVLGEAAYYYSAGDGVSLARAILTVIRSHEKRRQLIERGKAQARLYTWQRHALELAQLYQTHLKQYDAAAILH